MKNGTALSGHGLLRAVGQHRRTDGILRNARRIIRAALGTRADDRDFADVWPRSLNPPVIDGSAVVEAGDVSVSSVPWVADRHRDQRDTCHDGPKPNDPVFLPSLGAAFFVAHNGLLLDHARRAIV
jgi:hypothetical protein